MCVFSYSLRLDGIAGNFLLRTDFTESHRVWIVVLSSLFLSRCFFNFLFDFLQWLIHWFFSCILLASSCLCFLVVVVFFFFTVFLQLYCYFLTICSKKVLNVISVFFSFPSLSLWPSMWSKILDNAPCEYLRRMCLMLLLNGILYKYQVHLL